MDIVTMINADLIKVFDVFAFNAGVTDDPHDDPHAGIEFPSTEDYLRPKQVGMLVTVCAWCDKTLRTTEVALEDAGVSHGICIYCKHSLLIAGASNAKIHKA